MPATAPAAASGSSCAPNSADVGAQTARRRRPQTDRRRVAATARGRRLCERADSLPPSRQWNRKSALLKSDTYSSEGRAYVNVFIRASTGKKQCAAVTGSPGPRTPALRPRSQTFPAGRRRLHMSSAASRRSPCVQALPRRDATKTRRAAHCCSRAVDRRAPPASEQRRQRRRLVRGTVAETGAGAKTRGGGLPALETPPRRTSP